MMIQSARDALPAEGQCVSPGINLIIPSSEPVSIIATVKQPDYTTSPVDHYIQADVLRTLFRSDQSLTFSQLKPSGIENSLFMYHVRKLESRHLIKRTPDGFALTQIGARWINFISLALQPKTTPRPLINFIITSANNKQVLLSRRKGQGHQHLNSYLFPGGFHRYGQTLAQAAPILFESLTGTNTPVNYLGTIEMIYHLPGDYTHHIVGFFHEASLRDYTPAGEADYAYEWASIDEVLAGKYEPMPASVMQKYRDEEINGFSSLAADYSSS